VEPVRVKVYGLVSMTRRGYLMQLAVGGLLIVTLLAFWWLRWPEVRPEPAKVRDAMLRRVVVFLDNLAWIVGAVAVLLPIEAWFVLRRFARKEAERTSKPPESPVATTNPPSP
jgi:hypothetical protein